MIKMQLIKVCWIIGRFLGLIRTPFVRTRRWVVWGLGGLENLIFLYLGGGGKRFCLLAVDCAYWFEEDLSRKVENGNDTFFWTDRWFGDEVLCVRFQRLVELSDNKWTSVANMERLGWGKVGVLGGGGGV